MSVKDVVQAMYDNEYGFIADIPIHCDDYQSKPYFFKREAHEYCNLDPECLTSSYKVLNLKEDNPFRKKEAIKKTLDDNRDVVVSFVRNAPYLDYFECLVNNWGRIKDKFCKLSPGSSYPFLDNGYGIRSWWDEEKSISINFQGTRINVGWDEENEKHLLGIIENICGKKQDDLLFEVIWADSFKLNRDGVQLTD